MNPLHKQDFFKLISFALKEYCGDTLLKRGFMREGHISQSFGSLVADIAMITTENKHVYLRKYQVKNEYGKTVISFILGHVTMLFGTSARKFREDLLNSYSIRGVVTLKKRLFEDIAIPAAIIVLSNDGQDTWFTAAENMDALVNVILGTMPKDLKVYYSKKVLAENLLPEYYNGDDKIIQESFKGNETKELGEIATIVVGKRVKSEDYTEQGIPYLRARDIQNGKIIMPEVFINIEKAEQFSRQLIQEGDILLTKNFEQNKLALVTEDDVPAIASNTLFIIRPYEVSEGYLYRYLTSKTGNEIFYKQMYHIQKGVTIPSVSLGDLVHIEVPIFDAETMRNLESIDTLDKTDTIETTQRLATKARRGSELVNEVQEAFIKAGWNQKNLLSESEGWIAIGNNIRWRPDFVYSLSDKRIVYIEVKSDLMLVSLEWFKAMKQIIYGEEKCFFILTTGMYYEVHASGVEDSLRLLHAPTVEEVLDWEKEVR